LRAQLKAVQLTIGGIQARLQACVNTIHTVIDLNGIWASGGIPGPVISAGTASLTVDMSAYHRPPAHGTIVDSSTISVTFPDDATYTGKLVLPNTIRWSNNSAWTKVAVTTVPFVLNDPPRIAEQDVRQAGLVPVFTGSGATPSFVNHQSPHGGSTVPLGSVVHMTVVAGPVP
jgi:hypothetical protein